MQKLELNTVRPELRLDEVETSQWYSDEWFRVYAMVRAVEYLPQALPYVAGTAGSRSKMVVITSAGGVTLGSVETSLG